MNEKARLLRVLIVEDLPERLQILTSLYRAHAWVSVHTARRAIMLLDAYHFDIVSLDYNLRGEEDGADVARHLANSRNRETRVIVHSQNPAGAEEIHAILPRAKVFPIARMVKTNSLFKFLRRQIDDLGADFDWCLPPKPSIHPKI